MPLELFEHPLAQALALALVHFVWQGLLVALVLIGVVELLGLRKPQVRYACSLAALVVMAACPVVTLAVGGLEVGSQRSELSQGPGTRNQEPEESNTLAPGSWRLAADVAPGSWNLAPVVAAARPYALAAWLAGVAFFGCRLLAGLVGVQQLQRQKLPLPRELAERVERLGRSLGLRARSMVFLSRRVGEAMAVGLVRPIVLLPAAWASEMPLPMLEAVIAHELAHLHRRDLWVVLMERVVETLLFYHPAVWWLSGRLRAERELCCDELAVALTGRRLEYAQALETVARMGTRVEPLLAAGIRGERNMQLLKRVRSVLGLSAGGESSRLWPAGLVALLLPLAAWAWSAGLVTPQPSVAVADDDRDDDDDDDDDDDRDDADDRDDDDDDDGDDDDGDDDDGDDDDEKETAKKGDRDEREDGDEEKEVRKEGDKVIRKEGDKEIRRDGDAPRKEIRKDGDDPELAERKRARIAELKFQGKEAEAKRDIDVRKEERRDGDKPNKVGPKDGDKPIKVGPKDGDKPVKVSVKDGEGQVAELSALVKKLMAENAELKRELAAARGGKVDFRLKEGASEKEALTRRPAAEKEAAGREKEAAIKRAIAEKEGAGREKEAAAKRAIGEKEAVAEKEALKRAISEKEAVADKEALKRAIVEKEEAAARERKEGELRERKIKEVRELGEKEAIEKKKAEAAAAAERDAKEKGK